MSTLTRSLMMMLALAMSCGATQLEAATQKPMAAPVADAGEPSPAPLSAHWQKREYSFLYMGFTSVYSCDGLADKLRILLIASGARGDAKSSPGPCAAGFGGPDKFARADLTFYVLTPGDSATAGGDAPVAALWKPVVLKNLTPRELGGGDCELVEQFARQVLPLFSTRSIENRLTCVPNQTSDSNILLNFEALAPAVALRHGAKPVTPGPGTR